MSKRGIYTGLFCYDEGSQMIFVESKPDLVAQIMDDDAAAAALLLIRGWGGLRASLGERTAVIVQDALGRRVAQLLNTHGLGEELTGILSRRGNNPAKSAEMSLDDINRIYGTNYAVGMQILFRGLPCVIVGSENGRLLATADGVERRLILHPTWEITTAPAKGNDE